jgi:hypothetical protein
MAKQASSNGQTLDDAIAEMHVQENELHQAKIKRKETMKQSNVKKDEDEESEKIEPVTPVALVEEKVVEQQINKEIQQVEKIDENKSAPVEEVAQNETEPTLSPTAHDTSQEEVLKSPFTETDQDSFTGTYEDMTPRIMGSGSPASPAASPRSEVLLGKPLFFLNVEDTKSSPRSYRSSKSTRSQSKLNQRSLEDIYVGEPTKWKKKKKSKRKQASEKPSLDEQIKMLSKKPVLRVPYEIGEKSFDDLVQMNPQNRHDMYADERISMDSVAQVEKIMLSKTKSFSPFNIIESVQDELSRDEYTFTEDVEQSPRFRSDSDMESPRHHVLKSVY